MAPGADGGPGFFQGAWRRSAPAGTSRCSGRDYWPDTKGKLGTRWFPALVAAVQTVLKELRLTLALALPMIVGQVSQMLIGITDAAFIGRVGTVELAAAAFAHGIFGMFYIVGLGLLLPVGVFTARDHGAGDPAGCAAWLRHGRVMALAAGGAAFLLLAGLSTQLACFGQPPEVVAVVRPFFVLNSLSMVPVFYFQVQRQYLDALGRPWVGTTIMLADVALNALLNWIFIWGHLGAPALGLTGSGVATLTARTLAVTAIAVWLRGEADAVRGVHWSRFREMLHMGLPVGGSLLFESGAFAAAALMMGWLGATALAAHQIALQTASILFMVPFGISMAATVRVGHAVGRRDAAGTRRAGFAAIALAAIFMSAMVMLIIAFRHDIPLLFLGSDAADTGATVTLAATLLAYGATFFIVDGIQTVSAGALRGLNDTRVPMIFAAISFWGIGFATSYSMAFPLRLEAVGIWTGFTVGLGVYALLLVWRFNLLTLRGYMPPAPGHAVAH